MATNYLTIDGDTYRTIAEFIGIDAAHVAEAAHILSVFNYDKLGNVSIDSALPVGFNINAPGSSTLSDNTIVYFAPLFSPQINDLRKTYTPQQITQIWDQTPSDPETTSIASNSTIDTATDEETSIVDQAETSIVQELPDSVINALETTGDVTQNIVDTIYTATGADSTQNSDAEKTARAKKVLLGISAGILAFKIFS